MKTAHDLVILAKSHIQEITLDEADNAIRNANILIDVRETDEYQAGHLAGAINIPRGILEFKLSNSQELISRDLNIVLYCKTSGRAALAAQTMQEMGYLSVKSIMGGFDAWQAAGKPVINPSAPNFE